LRQSFSFDAIAIPLEVIAAIAKIGIINIFGMISINFCKYFENLKMYRSVYRNDFIVFLKRLLEPVLKKDERSLLIWTSFILVTQPLPVHPYIRLHHLQNNIFYYLLDNLYTTVIRATNNNFFIVIIF
jgi:hypothetical protein